jgi:hypothetical protein
MWASNQPNITLPATKVNTINVLPSWEVEGGADVGGDSASAGGGGWFCVS